MSRAPQVVAALYAVISAPGVLPDGALAFRGAYVHGNTVATVNVGYNGDPLSDTAAVTTTSDWAGLGAKRRNETVEVVSSIHLPVGDTEDASALAMEQAYEILAACEAAVHSDPSMGIPPPAWAIVSDTTYTEYLNETTGLQAALVWTLRAFERPQ